MTLRPMVEGQKAMASFSRCYKEPAAGEGPRTRDRTVRMRAECSFADERSRGLVDLLGAG